MYKVGDLVRVKETGTLFNIVTAGGLTLEDITHVADNLEWYKVNEVEPVTHLTTKEFIKLVGDMGYEVNKLKGKLHVMKDDFTSLAFVSSKRLYDIDTMQMNSCSKELFELLTLYARTPLELREEKEQLYTLELPNNDSEDFKYYNYNREDDKEYYLGDSTNDSLYQTHFTQKEIDELPNQELIKVLHKVPVNET